MNQFTQREFSFPDPRSAQELATAIWNYELLPERDFTTVNGKRIHSPAKKFACVSQDTGSQAVNEFRHALFTVMQNRTEVLTRRGIENAITALDTLATVFDGFAAKARKSAEVEFMDMPDGPVGRHTAEMAADINDAENHETVARKLRGDKELRDLVIALAKKLEIPLKPKERGI